MNTKAILLKGEVNEAEMIHVVTDYVRIRKGVSVDIKLGRASYGRNFTGADTIRSSPRELALLNAAFVDAAEWFANNRTQIPSK